MTDVDLGKWPRLLVLGSRVTEAQANEIIVRTNMWSGMTCNDWEWRRTVARIAGYELDDHGYYVDWRKMQAWCEGMGVLPLHYLHNDRIMSSWIGGPHGWCRWDGTIWTTTYNIGKWPSVEEVHADWQSIAAAFPYLSLRAQLVPDEGAGEPVVEWCVVDGAVVMREPTTPLPVIDLEERSFLSVLTIGGERGVLPDRLEAAIRQVRDA